MEGHGCQVLAYIAKHRHFGDDIWWITQAVGNVDKQFRSVTQEFRYARNLKKETFFGFNKMIGRGQFRIETYLEPMTGSQQIQDSKTLPLDPLVSKCYFTSMFNKGADLNEKRKGRPGWLMPVIFGSIVVAFAYLAMKIPDLVGWSFFAKKSQVQSELSSVVSTPQAAPTPVSALSSVRQTGPHVQTDPYSPLGTPINGVDPSFFRANPTLRDERQSKPLIQTTVVLKNARASKVIADMAGIFKEGGLTLAPSNDDGAILIRALTKQDALAAADMIKNYDRSPAQIQIRGVFLAVKQGKGSEFSLNWSVAAKYGAVFNPVAIGTGAGLITGVFTLGASTDGLSALVTASEGNSNVRIVSKPVMVGREGQEMRLASGREVPVPTIQTDASQPGTTRTGVEYKNILTDFRVTPILRGDQVLLKIAYTDRQISEYVQISGNQVPSLSTQEAGTEVALKRNQLLFFGGSTQTNNTNTVTGVPGLRNLPLVGGLFRQHKITNDVFRAEMYLEARVLNEPIVELGPTTTPPPSVTPPIPKAQPIPKPQPAATAIIEPTPLAQPYRGPTIVQPVPSTTPKR
jgi:Bacterial type II and III secretion system protein